jgi:hypothetical protein
VARSQLRRPKLRLLAHLTLLEPLVSGERPVRRQRDFSLVGILELRSFEAELSVRTSLSTFPNPPSSVSMCFIFLIEFVYVK